MDVCSGVCNERSSHIVFIGLKSFLQKKISFVSFWLIEEYNNIHSFQQGLSWWICFSERGSSSGCFRYYNKWNQSIKTSIAKIFCFSISFSILSILVFSCSITLEYQMTRLHVVLSDKIQIIWIYMNTHLQYFV